MSYVVINAISVAEGAGPELERRFAGRAGAVDQAPGFEQLVLLRPADGAGHRRERGLGFRRRLRAAFPDQSETRDMPTQELTRTRTSSSPGTPLRLAIASA